MWAESEEEKQSMLASTSNMLHPIRPKRLLTFIMDWIQSQALAIAKTKANDTIAPLQQKNVHDPVLLVPYKEMLEKIERKRKSTDPWIIEQGRRLELEVDALKEQVKAIRGRWEIDKGECGRGSFTNLKIEERQDRLRKRSQEFALSPEGIEFNVMETEDERKLFKASYAYFKHLDRFPWDVDFGSLCYLKSRSMPGSTKFLCLEFYYHSKLHRISKGHH